MAKEHTHQLGDKCLSLPVRASGDPRHVSYFCNVTGARDNFDEDPIDGPAAAE